MRKTTTQIAGMILAGSLLSSALSARAGWETGDQKIPFAKAKISVAADLKASFQKGGRIILHLSRQREKEPRFKSELTLGMTPEHWDISSPWVLEAGKEKIQLISTDKNIPPAAEKYYYQAVYKQNPDDGQENVPGNITSNIDSVILSGDAQLKLTLDKVIPPNEIVGNKFVKPVVIQSRYLSEFSGRPRYLRASVLLPSGYFKNPGKAYPICYRAPGLNGRYTAVNGHMKDKDFTDWWFSDAAPQVI